MSISDQTTDYSGAKTHQLVNLYGAPDFVKTGSYVSADELDGAAFAYPGRMLPVHTPRDTWLSAAFWTQQYGSMTKEAAEASVANILQAATLHGIRKEVTTLLEKAASLEEIMAQEDGVYGLEFSQDGKTVRSFPLNSVEEIKLASDKFDEKRKQLDVTGRIKLAEAIIKRATQLRASDVVSETVYKTAGCGYVMPKLISDAWWYRAAIVKGRNKEAEYKEAVVNAKAYGQASNASTSKEDIEKVAQQLSQYDTRVGLTHMYGNGLDYPEAAIYATSYASFGKMASQTVRLTTGSVYELTELQHLSLEKLAEVMGSDLADELRCPMSGEMDLLKAADVLSTLPKPDAVTLERLLAGTPAEPILMAKRAFSVLEPAGAL